MNYFSIFQTENVLSSSKNNCRQTTENNGFADYFNIMGCAKGTSVVHEFVVEIDSLCSEPTFGFTKFVLINFIPKF